MFDPRKEITEIKELAEKGETHASVLLNRLVTLLHDLIHGKALEASESEQVPPMAGDPTQSGSDVAPVPTDPNPQPSNIVGDATPQEPA